jgi:hypothetical protein
LRAIILQLPAPWCGDNTTTNTADILRESKPGGKMLASENSYNTEIPGLEIINEMTEEEITGLLQKYLDSYKCTAYAELAVFEASI